ncbi:MAG: hypothetical protein QXQ02_05005 [Halobacteria archaeon]
MEQISKLPNFGMLLFIFLLQIPLQVLAEEHLLSDGVSAIVDKIQGAISTLNNKPRPFKTIVLSFCWDTADQWEICHVVTELLRTQIARIGDLEIISRDSTNRALSVLKMDLHKGLLTADKIALLRQQLDFDLIITGCISDLYTIININVYLWDADGNLILTTSAQVRKTAGISSLLISPYSADAHDYYSAKWQSKPMPYRILSMSVNDVDEDRINVLIIVTESELKVLSWDGFSFQEKASARYIDDAQLRREQRDIRTMFVSDVDGDGYNEICVSIPDKETTLWRWKEGNLVKISTLPPTLLALQEGEPVFGLLKQSRNYFSGQTIYQISKEDKSRSDRPIPVDLYSVAIGEVNNKEGEEWIVVDNSNCMRIYSKDIEPIWQGEMTFGSGITTADLDRNGKNEIIGTSSAPWGRQDSLIILEWNGETYSKKWGSQPIEGSISALCVGDPNNDGADELVVAVFRHGGCVLYLYTANYIYQMH